MVLIGLVLDANRAVDLSRDERHEREGVSFYEQLVPSLEFSIGMLIRGAGVDEGERFVIRALKRSLGVLIVVIQRCKIELACDWCN